jgi:hypothetical protein
MANFVLKRDRNSSGSTSIYIPFVMANLDGLLMLFFLRDSKRVSQNVSSGNSSCRGACHIMPAVNSSIPSKLL